MDATSQSEESPRDSIEVIRHTNGAAPTNYKPHGQLGGRTFDTSRVYINTTNGTEGTNNIADYVASGDAQTNIFAPDTIGTVDNNASAGALASQSTPDPGQTSASNSTTMPVVSSAPIIESSNPEMTEKVKAIYNLIPEPIRTDYESNGWVIKIVPQDTIRSVDPWMSQVPKIFGILAGLTSTGDKTIYLDDKYATDAMAHEMGHYVDMVLLGSDDWPPSFSDEFKSIYDQEKNGFNSDYPKSDAHEYFAETFGLYIEYAGSMQQDFPRTYDYMES